MSDQLVEKALEISRKRREILEEMRQAIQAGDKDTVFRLARRLTGLSDEGSEKRHRASASVN